MCFFVVVRGCFADLTSVVEDLGPAPSDGQVHIVDDVAFEAGRRFELSLRSGAPFLLFSRTFTVKLAHVFIDHLLHSHGNVRISA